MLPGDDCRPADILVPNFAGGRDVALDVTVVHPIQDATMPQAATTPGFALSYAHDRKVRGAEEDCRRQGIAFIPKWQQSPSEGGTVLQRGRSGSWGLHWHDTLARRRERPSGTCGGDWASTCSEAMRLYWPTVCQFSPMLRLMVLSERQPLIDYQVLMSVPTMHCP